MPQKLFALPLALAVVLSAGCVEHIPSPKDQAAKPEQQARSTQAVEVVDHGPAANAPKLAPGIVNPMVEPEPTGKYGGTLSLPAYEDPKTFNPTLVSDETSSRFLAYAFDGLIDTDGVNFKITPALAESWTISPDGKTYTFKLRKGLRWQDGQPLTADDVVFTWMTVLPNPDIPWDARDVIKIDGKLPVVTEVDPLTVKFTLPHTFAPFMRSGVGAVPILPKHIWGPWMKKGPDGKLIANTKWTVTSDVKTIIGSGPFMFESYTPGERITFKRNPYYYRVNKYKQPLPYLDRLSIPFLKSVDTAILKFKAGETDAQALPGKDIAYLMPFRHEGNFTIYNSGPNFMTSYLTFNLNPGKNKAGKPFVDPIKEKWFQDKRFRQAIAYAINKKAIIKLVYRGVAAEQNSPIFQKSPYYDPNVPAYEYDPAKALALLQQAGFHENGHTLYDSAGHPVSFSMLTTVGSDEGTMTAQMIVENLAAIGIHVQNQPVTFNVLISRTDDTKDWDTEILGFGADVEPHSVANLWYSNGQEHLFDLNPTPQRHPAYDWEKQIDDCFDAGAATVDEAKRKAIYDKFQEIATDEEPMIYLPVSFYVTAVRNTVGNVRPSAYSILGSSWNCWELYKK